MRKRLIFHIGLPKTGSTAIQTFLAQHVSLLSEHGVAYPLIPSLPKTAAPISQGNALIEFVRLATETSTEISYDERAVLFFEKMIENALDQSAHDTILISAEELSKIELISSFKSLSEKHDVVILALVRDPYDITISSWKERIKNQGHSGTLAELAESIHAGEGRLSIARLADFARAGLNLRLVSYDRHRDDLIASFLNAIGIESPQVALGDLARTRHNLSLSLEEANLITLAYESAESANFGAHLLSTFSTRSAPFRDPTILELDEAIMTALQADIEILNTHLSPEDRLRTAPRPGISLADMTVSMATMKDLLSAMGEYIREAEPSASPVAPYWIEKGLPSDFDAKAYLLHNPDVAAAGVEAEAHYINNGRWEGRVYKRL